MWRGVWEPVSEVALEPLQVGAGGAIGDLAVRPDEVVRRLFDTKPRQRVPVDVLQGAGRSLAGQVLDGHHARVTTAQDAELAGVPVAGAAT